MSAVVVVAREQPNFRCELREPDAVFVEVGVPLDAPVV